MKSLCERVFDKISNEIMEDVNLTASSRFIDVKTAMFPFKNEIVSKIKKKEYYLQFHL